MNIQVGRVFVGLVEHLSLVSQDGTRSWQGNN